MYCPVCGGEGTEGLKFCKRCGASLTQPKDSGSGVDYGKLAGMFWAIAVFGFISLAMLIGSIIPLTVLHAQQDVIMMVMLFGSAAIVSIAVMLVRQLSRLISIAKGEESATQPIRRVNTNQFSQPQISAPPQQFGSVTENTTRNFDAAYKDSERQK